MFKKILVPLDGSSLAEQALPTAVFLAGKMQVELILLSVAWREPAALVEPMGYGMWLPEESDVNIHEQMGVYLEQTVAKYATVNLPIRHLLREGDEAGMIVDTAVSEQVDLIIMTTHGRSGLSRWLMGSVTEKVLRQPPCSILVLRDGTLPEHIIVTLDGSELAETALLPGLALSQALGLDVTLLQVDEGTLVPPSSQVPKKESLRYANLYLQTVIERFGHEPLKTAVLHGKPAEAILDYAEKVPDSLIVISTHGRTGLARWVFGSVADKIVRGAASPVLVIRPPAGRLQNQ